MTFKINRSEMPDGFEVAVAAHAFELRNWRSHMTRVEQDKKKAVDDPTKHVAHPAPSSHPAVVAAIDENGEANYEIIEDGPTEEEVLAKKKKALIDDVSQAEYGATCAVVPLGKQRMFDIRETKIMTEETNQVRKVMQSQTWLDKIKSSLTGSDAPKVTRSKADSDFIAMRAEHRAKIEAIRLVAAQAHHDIEDLTSENVDSWKMPEFPK